MKKVVLLAAFAVAALVANAQVLRNEFLKDYKPGDKLEKGIYQYVERGGRPEKSAGNTKSGNCERTYL